MFDKSTCFKQVCQLLLSLIVACSKLARLMRYQNEIHLHKKNRGKLAKRAHPAVNAQLIALNKCNVHLRAGYQSNDYSQYVTSKTMSTHLKLKMCETNQSGGFSTKGNTSNV